MSQTETLKDALLKEDPTKKDQIDSLTPEAQAFTKQDIVDILNYQRTDVTIDTIISLRRLAKTRLRDGLNVLPWPKLDGLNITDLDDKMIYGW